MAGTVIRSYDDYERALTVVGSLEAAGVPPDAISILGRRMDAIEQSADEGFEAGTLVGSGAGLLGALISLPISGLGPVLAAGWLVAGTALGAVAGAAAGSLISALVATGMVESEAHVLAESVRRGGAIVAVRASDDLVAVAQAVMAGGKPLDPVRAREAYESEGWTHFDEKQKMPRAQDDLSGVVS
ncbi:hypothetical protein [Bosea thiooxidans]